jgi:hypothetical protein
MLDEYKEKRNADNKKENLKTLGSNGAAANNRDEHTAYLAAIKLKVKVTVLVETGFDYSAIPRSTVEVLGSVAFLSRRRCCQSPSCLLWLSGAKSTNRSAVRPRSSCRR